MSISGGFSAGIMMMTSIDRSIYFAYMVWIDLWNTLLTSTVFNNTLCLGWIKIMSYESSANKNVKRFLGILKRTRNNQGRCTLTSARCRRYNTRKNGFDRDSLALNFNLLHI